SGVPVGHGGFIANKAMGGTGGGPPGAGGINNINGPITPITDSIFTDNQAIAGDGSGNPGFGRGGGIYNNAGTATVENSTFLGNLARGGSNNIRTGALVGPAGGAGIFNADGAILFLSGSTFT